MVGDKAIDIHPNLQPHLQLETSSFRGSIMEFAARKNHTFISNSRSKTQTEICFMHMGGLWLRCYLEVVENPKDNICSRCQNRGEVVFNCLF